jgi:hypothetical protein
MIAALNAKGWTAEAADLLACAGKTYHEPRKMDSLNFESMIRVLREADERVLKSIRARNQPAGTGVQKHLLEPETSDQFERDMNRSLQNTRRRAEVRQNRSVAPLATDAANTILSW